MNPSNLKVEMINKSARVAGGAGLGGKRASHSWRRAQGLAWDEWKVFKCDKAK